MISMAKTLKAQGEAIIEMKKGDAPASVPTHAMASPLFPPPTSSVQHEHGNKNAKINVQFDGHLGMSEKERMDESIRFMRELEELLQAYNVIHLDGTYDRIPTGTI